MSHMYSLALVPFDIKLNGNWHDFLKSDPEDSEDCLDELVNDVEFLEGGQRMNGTFTGMFNEDTEGLWQAFLEGGPFTWDSNGRFVLLDARRIELLSRLKTYIPQDDTKAYHLPFRTLFAEIEQVLREYYPHRNIVLVIN